MSKKGVILLNLGSPDSTEVSDVRSYLREFLMDGRVLDAPFAIRWFLVNCLILPTIVYLYGMGQIMYKSIMTKSEL